VALRPSGRMRERANVGGLLIIRQWMHIHLLRFMKIVPGPLFCSSFCCWFRAAMCGGTRGNALLA
jgi:hypothetical protein